MILLLTTTLPLAAWAGLVMLARAWGSLEPESTDTTL